MIDHGKELQMAYKEGYEQCKQDAIDVLNKMKIYRPLDSDRYVISDCLNRIVNLPLAQPNVSSKEGYWIYLDNDELRYDSYRCSNCNRSITVDAERKDDIGFIIEDMRYCPNCGAKMIEVKS